jgi:hypothetical protein
MRKYPDIYHDFLLSDDEYIVRLGKKYYEHPKQRRWQTEAFADEFDDHDDEYSHDFGDENDFEFADNEDDPEN